MYTLYTIPGSCSTGIAVLMKKLGVSFQSVTRDDVPNYAEIVPTNQVPAIKTPEGKILTEGVAITLYLLEKYGAELLPQDALKRAEFYQWLNFDYATLHPAYSKIFAVMMNENLDEAIKQELMQYMADKVSATWQILDSHLEGRKFICGDTPCHADYMAVIYTSWEHYFPTVKITFGANVKRLVEDIKNLPEFTEGYSADGAEFKMAV